MSEDLIQTPSEQVEGLSGHPDVLERWQPIKTAPKDREILVSDADGFMQVVEWDVERAPPFNWAVKDGANHHRDLFTHWMPLPSAPTSSEERSDTASPQAEQQPDIKISENAKSAEIIPGQLP